MDADKVPDMPPSFTRRYTLAALLFVAVLAAYFNALTNRFVYDDIQLVETNPLIKAWHNLPDIFATGYWTGAFGMSDGLYRPLTIASFLVDHTLGGAVPFVYHVNNVLLHFLCSLLAYLVIRALTGRETPAAFASLLFAAHPVHTEAVAWVSGRAELLSVFLLLLSFLVFLAGNRRPLYALLSSLAFFMALLAKETAVVLPAIIAVYVLLYEERVSAARTLRNLALRLLPFVLALAAYLIIRSYALGSMVLPPAETIPLYEVGPYQRFLTMCTAFFHYVRLAFMPTDLSAFYYFFTRSIWSLPVLSFLLAAALLIYYSRRLAVRHRDAFFGISWFFIALLPVSNLVPVGIIMSERAMYLPSVGSCLLLGLAFSRAAENTAGSGATVRRSVVFLFTALLALFTTMSILRNPYWKDPAEFQKQQLAAAKDHIRVNPASAANYTRLANLRVFLGLYDDETARIIERGLAVCPTDPSLHLVRGMLLERQGRDDEALEEFNASLSVSECEETYNWASGILLRKRQLNAAERMIDRAIRLNPYRGSLYFNKGIIRYQKNDPDAAYALFERAASLNPEDGKTYYCMGVILNGKGDAAGAAAMLDRALLLNPSDRDAADLRRQLGVGR